MFASCCEWFGTCPPDPDPDPPVQVKTYEDAIKEINTFKDNLLESASPGAVALRSSQAARVSQVWIFHECKSTIQNPGALLLDKFTESNYRVIEDDIMEKSFSFHWENSWTNSQTIGLDIKYELLETILKAVKENSQIYSIDFNMSFREGKYETLNLMSDLRNEYEDYLTTKGEKAEGNIIVSGLIKGKLRIEYKAYNEKKEKINFNLSLNANKLFEDKLTLIPGYEFLKDKGSSGEYSVVEESGENATVFAIEFFRIPDELQDKEDITEKIVEFCNEDETLVKIKTVNGYCLTNKENIIKLDIEADASGDRLYFYWTNLANIPITYFYYTLTIRNRNGQILYSNSSFLNLKINPGIKLQKGYMSTLLPGLKRFKLEDVEFELDIVEARNVVDIICN